MELNKRGDRVRLIRTDDPHTKLQPGDEGTVKRATRLAVDVQWDSGSILSLVADAGDRWETL